ncbi:MAG: ABC transporter substrate-binding protein [Thermomicrobiales bacterium]
MVNARIADLVDQRSSHPTDRRCRAMEKGRPLVDDSAPCQDERPQGSRLTRRTLLGQVTAIGVGAIAADALATPAAASPAIQHGNVTRAAQEAGTPTGQILRAANMSELTTLHPFMTRFTSAKAAAYHINEGLTKFEADFSIVPGLATEWVVSDDQLTLTFTLRQGVMWHDGQPLTAKDVRFTLDAAGASDSQSPALGVMTEYVQSVETPDDGTVVITLTKPYSPLLAVLAEQLLILPSHILEGNVYDDEFSQLPIGTGPYRVAERQTSFITLEHNPDYWGEPPFTATIILRDAPDAAAAQAGLLAGELEVVGYDPTTMEPLLEQGFQVFQGLAGSIHGLDVDLQNPILQDLKVRQALMLGLDRERIKEVQYANGLMAKSVISPAYGQYHDESLPDIARDIEAAGALLDEAGWTVGADDIREKDGQPLALRFQAWAAQSWQNIAAITQASWKEIGVDVTIETVELARLVDTLSGTYDIAPNGWNPGSDPILGLTVLFGTTDKTIKDGGTNNVFHYTNPDVDAALAEAYATTDVAQRVELAHQVQQQVVQDLPFLILAHPRYELMCTANIVLDETGTGELCSVGTGFFMNRWRVEG